MKLHRINGFDAREALLAASREVEIEGTPAGPPLFILEQLLLALERRGFYLGVEDRP
jgi:hypothetical protein